MQVTWFSGNRSAATSAVETGRGGPGRARPVARMEPVGRFEGQ